MKRMVYLSPVPWDSFTQRPHKFVEWFHEISEGEVLWVDPYPTRLPSLSDFSRRSAPGRLGRTESWLECLTVKALPVEPIPVLNVFNRYLRRELVAKINAFASLGATSLVIGKPSALALQLLKEGAFEKCIYDSMDDFPAFYSGLSKYSMQCKERAVVRNVDHVLVSSTLLMHRAKDMHPTADIRLCENACAVEVLPPVDLMCRPASRILGYVGTIGKWFDWELIRRLAECTNVTVRLIGPVYTPAPFTLPANVEMLPQCSHAQAIAAMQGFDVGLIPFKITELTESVDPIKYYEYRALGLPIITSAFGEMRVHAQQEGVFSLDASDKSPHLLHTVEAALAYRFTLDDLELFRQKNSWSARFSSAALLSGV